jgi:hypothetical protein
VWPGIVITQYRGFFMGATEPCPLFTEHT